MTDPTDTKDESMVDVSRAADEQPPRRKSTLILTDEMDVDKVSSLNAQSDDSMHVDKEQREQPPPPQREQGPLLQLLQLSGSHAPLAQLQQEGPEPAALPDPNATMPIEIKWVQGGEKVYVTGSFTGWRKMIGLTKQPEGDFSITLGLPEGTHRFRFVIDNELRFSDFLPTATDQMGNFVNYVEVTQDSIQAHHEQVLQLQLPVSGLEPEPPSPLALSVSRKSSISRTKSTRSGSIWGLTNDDDDMGNGYSRYHDEVEATQKNIQYITDIPPIFTDPKVMEQYYVAIDKQAKSQSGLQQAWLHPPQLPPHLDNVILNNFNSTENNSGALPIPNHVVLNHLATTSIKHNTLAVASIVRYKRKYVTQVLCAPLPQ